MVLLRALAPVVVCALTSTASAADHYGNFLNATFSGSGTVPSDLERYQVAARATANAPFPEIAPSGAVSFGIGFELPPAIVQPSVSLGYSSEAGTHGWLGRGWNVSHGMTVRQLTGVALEQARSTHPEVTRVLEVQGGGVAGRFLICDTCDGGSVGAVWQSPSPSHAVLVQGASSGTIVVAVDATEWTLKRPLDDDGQRRGDLWLPVSLEDAHGNRADWSYTKSRLDQVTYGGNATSSAHIRLDFLYTAASNTSYSAANGFLEEIDERLSAVAITTKEFVVGTGWVFGERQRYLLEYDSDDEHLVEVRHGGPFGNGSRLLHRFDYSGDPGGYVMGDGVPPFQELQVSRPVASAEPTDERKKLESITAGLRDLSADGLPDAVGGGFGEYGEHRFNIYPAVGAGDGHRDWEFVSPQSINDPDDEGLTTVYDMGILQPDFQREVDGTDRSVTVVVDEGDYSVPPTARSATYQTDALLDIDGDGYLDMVASWVSEPKSVDDAVPYPALSNEALNTTPGDTSPDYEWTVCYGGPLGAADCHYDQPAPTRFLSIGSSPYLGEWTDPAQNYQQLLGISDGSSYEYFDGHGQLVDVDGDGRLDYVVVQSNGDVLWFRMLGRGAGWSRTPELLYVQDTVGPVGPEGTRRLEAVLYNHEIDHVAETIDVLAVDYLLEKEALRDINGDGRADRVIADADPWQVYLGTGDGLSATAIDWPAPRDYLTKSVEAVPMIYSPSTNTLTIPGSTVPPPEVVTIDEIDFYTTPVGLLNPNYECATIFGDLSEDCVEWIILAQFGEAMGELGQGEDILPAGGIQDPRSPVPPPTGGVTAGRRGGVTAGLIDMDGDGRPDYFDGDARQWFRNEGDGFATASTSLPSGMPLCGAVGRFESGTNNPNPPACLSMTQSKMETVTQFDVNDPASFHGDVTGTLSNQRITVIDVNGDRLPDVIVEDGLPTFDDEVDGTHYRGGVDPVTPPGLLVEVESGAGLITSFEYQSTALVAPAGQVELAASPSSAQVVERVTLEDPFDGGWAERVYTFFGRVCEFAGCRGFAHTAVEATFSQVDFGGSGVEDLVTTTSVTSTDAYDTVQPEARVVEERHLDDSSDIDLDFDPADGSMGVYGAHRYRSLITYASYGSMLGPVNLWRSARTDTEYRGSLTTNQTERSVSSTSTFDARGNLVEATHSGGTASPDDDVKMVASYTSDATGALQRLCGFRHEVGAAGEVVERVRYRYDHDDQCGGLVVGPQQTYPYEITGPGLLTYQAVSAGPVGDIDSEKLYWDFDHSARGQLVEIVHPHGATTTTTYGFGGAVPVTQTNALGWVTDSVLDAMGRSVMEIDPNGVVSEVDYDDFGRPVKTHTTGVGGPQLLQSLTAYTEADLDLGLPAIVSTTQYSYGANAAAFTTSSVVEHLDGTGRVQVTTTVDEGGGYRYAWSWDGLLGEPQASWVTSSATTFTSTPFAVRAMEADLDSWRRVGPFGDAPVAYSPASGTTTTTYPEVGRTHIEHAGLYTKQLHTDALGRLRHVDEGATGTTLVRTGNYTYDPLDRVDGFLDANGNTYRYLYDGAGRVVEVSRDGAGPAPEELWVSYTYDEMGPLPATMVPAGTGESIVFSYDDLGRPTELTLTDPVYGPESYTWSYDSAWLGALDSSHDPTGSNVYTYEATTAPFGARGLRTSETRTWLPVVGGVAPSLAKLYTYDGQGRVLQAHWPSGAAVHTTYHPNGMATEQNLVMGGTTFPFDVSYDTWGQYAGWSTPSGDQLNLVRSMRDRVDGFDYSLTSSGNTVDGTLDYTYQADGLMTARGAKTYSHDNLRRILPNPTTDVLDPLGLPRNWDFIAYQPADQFGEIPARATSNYTYDTFGNVSGISQKGWSLQYDTLQRLGRIVELDTSERWFHYDVDNELVLERHMANGVLQSAKLSFAGVKGVREGGSWTLYEQVLPWVTIEDGVPRYVVKEPFGQSMHVVDMLSGTVVADDQADIFGEDIDGTVGNWPIDELHGGVRDLSDTVMHAGARHYLVDDGRWLQPEPLLYSGLTAGDLTDPLIYGPVYARGNSNMYADLDGNITGPWVTPWVVAAQHTALSEGVSHSEAMWHPHTAGKVAAVAAVGTAVTAGGAAAGAVSARVAGSGALRGIQTAVAQNSARLNRFALGVLEMLEPSGAGLGMGKVLGTVGRALGKSGCSFPVDTEVLTTAGPVGIDQVLPGDVVVAFDEDARLDDPYEVPGRVMADAVGSLPPGDHRGFDPLTARWGANLAAEVLVDGAVYRRTAGGWSLQGHPEPLALERAEAVWARRGLRGPHADDWVWLFGDDERSGHWPLAELVGTLDEPVRVAFLGTVFEVAPTAAGTARVSRTTEVLARVTHQIPGFAEELVATTVGFSDGETSTLWGTPEHPFYLPKEQSWRPLGALAAGDELHTASGLQAVVLRVEREEAAEPDWNLTVADEHNFFVRPRESDSAALLAHNVCFRGALSRNAGSFLRNKQKRISNQAAAGGNRGVSGSVSGADAEALGQAWVGDGAREFGGGMGLISKDGTRVFRRPSAKRGVNASTGEPWSKTGVQSNFEVRSQRADGRWQIDANVHLDVEP